MWDVKLILFNFNSRCDLYERGKMLTVESYVNSIFQPKKFKTLKKKLDYSVCFCLKSTWKVHDLTATGSSTVWYKEVETKYWSSVQVVIPKK